MWGSKVTIGDFSPASHDRVTAGIYSVQGDVRVGEELQIASWSGEEQQTTNESAVASLLENRGPSIFS